MTPPLMLGLAGVSAAVVWADARRAAMPRPWLWALCVFGFWAGGLPLYLYCRLTQHRHQQHPEIIEKMQ